MDLAASVQAVTEEVVLRLTRALASESGQRNLCLAGGVALNCVANGKILRDGKFDEIFVQPAAGDAGGALGAALAVYFQENQGSAIKNAKRPDSMHGAYLGPSYAQSEIEDRLKAAGAVFTVVDDAQLIEKTAAALAVGQAVGWHQGRMKFGPRALGNRSILGDPRSPTMQKALNLKVKYRESFRPFAPSVLREKVADWFELDADSPYMLLVAPVKEQRCRKMSEAELALFGIDKLNVQRSDIPAVTHVDDSARIQTVDRVRNPDLFSLLNAFDRLTGCPVMINTSFNVRGEPIVCTPADAYRCFMATNMDALAVNGFLLLRDEQPAGARAGAEAHVGSFEKD